MAAIWSGPSSCWITSSTWLIHSRDRPPSSTRMDSDSNTDRGNAPRPRWQAPQAGGGNRLSGQSRHVSRRDRNDSAPKFYVGPILTRDLDRIFVRFRATDRQRRFSSNRRRISASFSRGRHERRTDERDRRAAAARKGEVLLSVENVSLRFGGVKAITDVSFDIRKGEVRAIIGPNGAGKTSMLNCINGFYHPQEGQITYQGRAPRQDEAAPGGRRRHRPHLPERRAVQGHVDARQHHDRPHAEDEARASSGRRCATARR